MVRTNAGNNCDFTAVIIRELRLDLIDQKTRGLKAAPQSDPVTAGTKVVFQTRRVTIVFRRVN